MEDKIVAANIDSHGESYDTLFSFLLLFCVAL